MKDNYISNIKFNNCESYDWACVLSLAFSGKYDEALLKINTGIAQTDEVEKRNIATIMFVQILALMGCKDVANMLLEGLRSNLKSKKLKNFCERTIDACNE